MHHAASFPRSRRPRGPRRTHRAWSGSALLLSAVALLLAPVPAGAQQEPGGTRVWVGAGLGPGHGANTPSALGLTARLAWQHPPHELSVRGLALVDPFGAASEAGGELGVLYGRVRTGWLGHAGAATGVAVTGFERCGEAGAGCTTLGVPLVVETALRITSVIGLGVQGFANLNPESVYGGAVAFVQLGWLGEG